MKILIACYSLTGNTRALAQELRNACADACVEEIRDERPRGKFGTVAHAFLANLRKREPALAAPHSDPADFDLVLIGGPVWGRRIAPQVRAYARRHGARAPRVGFFCTLGGDGAPAAFAELEQACGQAPVATLAVDELHRAPDLHAEAAQRFLYQARAVGNGTACDAIGADGGLIPRRATTTPASPAA
jgi:flavodoxin